ncbi:hypothetical protein VMCG_07016 [Cytospora schulzeri]|uniref:Apple domain-containing protein n=1 Tax=Cytospora schulzeri TaxID=448051 RepID=A0A423W423_9PEZI|nr:hypothetical protein VMCG_07016 [Valsa malicola]
MRSIPGTIAALAALFGGATAGPSRVEQAEMAPNACTSDMPGGLGPTVVPDTPAAFLNFGGFANDAISTTNLAGYANVAYNQNAWAERTTTTSMGWLNLADYDVTACGTYCNNTAGCLSFDIFFQRSPTVAPSFNSSCPNPPSMTSVMCWIYSNPMTTADLVNTGETRGQFQVVIAGSNLFNKVVP